MATTRATTLLPTLPKPTTPLFIFHAGLRPALHHPSPPLPTRQQSTSSTSTNRRAITIANDTGRVPWRDLSSTEKAARTAQQTLNLGVVLVGLAATIGVTAVLYLEVFSTDSKTAVFNRCADRVRGDPHCRALLSGEKDGEVVRKRDIKAYGEPSWSRWARNRTVASRVETDRAGNEVLRMHFYVEGKAAKGTVQVVMRKGMDQKEWVYELLALDVPGQQRHYLEGGEGLVGGTRKAGKMFGVRWS